MTKKSKMCNHSWAKNIKEGTIEIFDREDPERLLTTIPIVEMLMILNDFTYMLSHSADLIEEVERSYYEGDFDKIKELSEKLRRRTWGIPIKLDNKVDGVNIGEININPDDFNEMIRKGGKLQSLGLVKEQGEWRLRPAYTKNPMSLPQGKTCGDCYAYSYCKKLFGCKESNTECDYNPIRFIQK